MNTVITFDINNIIISIVAIIFAIAIFFFIKWLNKKSDNETVEKIKAVLRTLCSYAQTYLKGEEGQIKMSWVLDHLQNQYNIPVTEQTIQMAEAIYRELKASGELFDE